MNLPASDSADRAPRAGPRPGLLCCPRCRADLPDLTDPARCAACGRGFPLVDGFVDFIEPDGRDRALEEVTRFYRRFPFPGYSDADDATALLERSRRSPFLDLLDRAIPADARVLECGCGTGQLSAFLGLAGPHREIVALDACDASLAAAAGFKERVGLRNVHLFRADLFELPVREAAFDVVVSRGVVHHTPDPARAIDLVARRVAPGGLLVLGFYESLARLPHRMRRGLGSLRGEPLRALDPVLRRTDLPEEKRRAWIEDQYRHPLERLLPLPRVLARLEAAGFGWVRSLPPVEPEAEMFEATARPGAVGMTLRRLGWACAGLSDPDAGLVSLVVRRDPGAHRS